VVASKITVVSAEYPKMFQWKFFINLKATNILLLSSRSIIAFWWGWCVHEF